MFKKYNPAIFSICIVLLLSGCTALKLGSEAVITMGKIVAATITTTGKVVTTTGKVITTVIGLPGRRKVIKLTKKGNRFLVDVILNRKIRTQMVLDTGCTDTQISTDIARKLGIKKDEGEEILCKLAGGHVVSARKVVIKEVRVSRVRVLGVDAIVLDRDKTGEYGGLLGMSFLDNFIFKIDTDKAELVLEKRKK